MMMLMKQALIPMQAATRTTVKKQSSFLPTADKHPGDGYKIVII